MAITRYEPWSLLNQLQRELQGSRDEKASEGSIATAEWVPAVDIKEEADLLLLLPIFPASSRKILKSVWKRAS
jgi:HSP20 family protein